jgi:hypothetical protein
MCRCQSGECPYEHDDETQEELRKIQKEKTMKGEDDD